VRILITGGSGFIGTNLVQHFAECGHAVASFDLSPPRNPLHRHYWVRGDLRQAAVIRQAVSDFSPDAILHMAARTDLDGRTMDDYAANVGGVANLVEAAANTATVRRVIFGSSMLVCRLGYLPESDTDYCPNTIYGESKVVGEQLVRTAGPLPFEWSIVRPTSIWGPWFDVPYRVFFDAVRRGRFVCPRGLRTQRTYGFVLNAIEQLAQILQADARLAQGSTFYLGDYDPVDVKMWANMISKAFDRGPVREVPAWIMRTAAKVGDFAQFSGVKSPPLTTFRLRNLSTSSVSDLTNTRLVCPTLPFDMATAVQVTVRWIQNAT
jgi:GlcNAc-P-P-Und epimerase